MIIVTGSSGFIGGHVARRLDEEGTDVLVVDRLSVERCLSLSTKCMHKEILPSWLRGMRMGHLSPGDVEAVVHMGACTDTTCNDWHVLLSDNVRYSMLLWEWCRIHNRPFIYASSAATYGDGSQGFSDDHDLIRSLRPLNKYGWSKHAFDQWCLRKASSGLAPPAWAGLKFFNVYGRYEAHKGHMASMVSRGLEQAQKNGVIRLFWDGQHKRDFVYVDDVVSVVTFMLDHKPAGIYNVGTGAARSFNVMASAIFAALGKKTAIEYFEMPEEIVRNYQSLTQADVSKLRAMGYRRDFESLENGIRLMLA